MQKQINLLKLMKEHQIQEENKEALDLAIKLMINFDQLPVLIKRSLLKGVDIDD